MKQFNIQIFNENMELIEENTISSKKIIYDYLTLDDSVFDLPYLSKVKIGFFIIVYNPKFVKSDVYSWKIYEGIVNDVESGKFITTIYAKPVLSLLDINVYYDISTLTLGLENWFDNIVEKYYETNTDLSMNFDRVYFDKDFTTIIQTTGIDLGLESNIFNLLDITRTLFYKYGIKAECLLYNVGSGKKLRFTLIPRAVIEDRYRIIETRLSSTIECILSFEKNKVNKLTFVNKANESQTITYYLKSNGNIETDFINNRIMPIVMDTQYIDIQSDFDTETLLSAESQMSISNYNNYIEITMLNSTVSFYEWYFAVGENYRIVHDNIQYIATLTAYEYLSDSTINLTFGSIRKDLTQILKLEGR